MKTTTIEPHTLYTDMNVSNNTFALVFVGNSPGGKEIKVRVELDGPLWVEEIARELHRYIVNEQNKVTMARNAMFNGQQKE